MNQLIWFNDIINKFKQLLLIFVYITQYILTINNNNPQYINNINNSYLLVIIFFSVAILIIIYWFKLIIYNYFNLFYIINLIILLY